MRGCVGALSRNTPLAATVAEMAYAAALKDGRFDPVAGHELASLQIEISVLSPLEPLVELSDLTIGRDGLLVSGLGCRGVLLPQVAEDLGWDAEMFAEQTCLKAGLPKDGFRRLGVRMFRFSAEVISEADVLPPGP